MGETGGFPYIAAEALEEGAALDAGALIEVSIAEPC
jgi:hypothetical protein